MKARMSLSVLSILASAVWIPGPSPARGAEAGTVYRAQVFHAIDCPQDPVGDRFVGFDYLAALMGREGLKLYRSPTESVVSGPKGIFGANDVIVIKINYQWSERGGTNTDLLRGVIRRIADHPDGFTGEIVVCENAQFASTNGFDRANNNAQDHTLSPHDVVVHFQGEGLRISHFDWTAVRGTQVQEYLLGDMNDGYIVYGYDPALQGRVSYPKFRTDEGTYVSLKYGIWDPQGGAYDREHLKFLNIPVLKSHHATYGATVSVKDYMGVVTGSLGTNSHSAIGHGLLGALLGEIQLADLNLIDCVWINANPYSGPATSYGEATRRDQLVASTDPVAADIWAVKNILVPAFIENGHNPPWPYPSADPDDPNSAFRLYLDHSMNRILDAGYVVTNDLDRIDAFEWAGAGDFDGDGDIDEADADSFAACFTGPGGPIDPGCEAGDFDGDGDVDCDDWEEFRFVWTGPGDPPDFGPCSAGPGVPALGGRGLVALGLLLLAGGAILVLTRICLRSSSNSSRPTSR